MKRFLQIMNATMEVPEPFGLFHIVCWVLTALVTLTLCVFFRNTSDKNYRTILLVVWAIMVIFEAIKQFKTSIFFAEDGSMRWEYQWSTFPLQLCDSPFYVLPPVALMRKSRTRDALTTYLCTFILLGGLATYIFPSTSFSPGVYANVHTMVHHGLQIAVCLFIGVWNRRRFTLHGYFGAILVFVAAVCIATTFNIGMHAVFPDAVINMFYISPYFKKTMPIFNAAWQEMPFLLCIFFYIAAVTMIASGFYLVYMLLFHRCGREEEGQESEEKIAVCENVCSSDER